MLQAVDNQPVGSVAENGSVPCALAIHRPHDHVDGAKDRHDVCDFRSLEDMGKDLKVIEVSSADFETPWCDVIVALYENADFSLA